MIDTCCENNVDINEGNDHMRSSGVISVLGPASVYRHRLQEAKAALDNIRPFGVFDADPAPGYTRSTTHIEQPNLGLRRVGDFPVIVIKDHSATEQHIAILASQPNAKVIFSRHNLGRIADQLAYDDDHCQSGVKSKNAGFGEWSSCSILPFA